MKIVDFDNAVVLIDKPVGRTSFEVISQLRRIIGVKKIGHCGTLDKFASGLLVACTGKASRLARYFLESDKCYSGIIKLGVETDTYDLTGEVVAQKPFLHVTEDMLREAAKDFLGIIKQQPPSYSSLKIDGKRASDRVRRGEDISLKSRDVTIYRFDIKEFSLSTGEIFFEIECSKGTYIRSIARDFGIKLGTVAHLQSLRRERSGNFRIEDAETVDSIKTFVDSGEMGTFIINPTEALIDFGRVFVSDEAASKISHGAFFTRGDVLSLELPSDSKPFVLLDGKGNLIAIADIDLDKWLIDYHMVFNSMTQPF